MSKNKETTKLGVPAGRRAGKYQLRSGWLSRTVSENTTRKKISIKDKGGEKKRRRNLQYFLV